MKVLLLCFFLVCSCGRNPTSHKNVGEFTNQETHGDYEAELIALNHQKIHRKGFFRLHGRVKFSVKGDEFKVNVNSFHLPFGYHYQSLYVGSNCPTEKDDLNHDGFIDDQEGSYIWGKQLLPFDRNINNQIQGKDFRKLADNHGHYRYFQTGGLSRILAALHSIKTIKYDHNAVLAAHEDLNLAGRVLVIHGVDQKYIIPKTVKSNNKFHGSTTLPIACAVVKRKKSI